MGVGSYVQSAKENVLDTVSTQAMLQREIQMSINIARARDSLQWYGGLYATFITGVSLAKISGKPVPAIAAVPAVIGGFMLTNMYDMAYGTKLQRIVKEAEYMIENERGRFPPPKQAMFAKKYTEEEKNVYANVGAVSTYWPGFLPWARKANEDTPVVLPKSKEEK
eukprot:CAMPEP_0170170126 /NCGR_PEP_ID=MMETSP0040_2-20121228/3081_1 /TAXON_ID=641309 /ORGANISM="Lotharella oceanica, Strain CCMP622" /LENGTH=165 /DNA_ID=CAMNT_0010409303 /DNA_START=20 /DNA_END=517 /DNA_ORIENTATION=-